MNLQYEFGSLIITHTLNIALCKRDGITETQTDKRMDGQMDDPIARCLRQTFQAET